MDASTSTPLHPGPLVNDVLFLHDQHRAAALFNGYIVDTQLQIRRCDGGFWQHTPIPDRVLHYIQLAGFGGILGCGYIQIDHALITALVERWRPETHTFHFPIGEATVTLQDVEVLWGLHIDGEPVTGIDTLRRVEEWMGLCQQLLGFTPPTGAIKGGRIKVGCLAHALDVPLPDDASEEACLQRARIYMMVLFGGMLFSDKSGYAMPLIYLPMLEDLEITCQYSWGGAVLANLYRNLCDATSPTAAEIAGPLVLLQIWAWERIPVLRPVRREPIDDFQLPYGARWKGHFDISRVPMHVLPAYRDQLTSLRYDEFIWQPYSEDILAALPPCCTNGSDIWRSVTYLICWHIVESHLANRVLRQFGLNQPIPMPRLMDDFKKIHKMDRRGRANNDWQLQHRAYIAIWADRHNLIEAGDVIDDPTYPSTEYMAWYRSRTVIYVYHPSHQYTSPQGFQGVGSTAEYLMDVVSRIHFMSMDHMAHCEAQDAVRFAEIRDFTRDSMRVVRESHRLDIQSLQVPPEIPQPSMDPRVLQRQPRNARRARQGGRRRRVRSPEEDVEQETYMDVPLNPSLSNIEVSPSVAFEGSSSHIFTPPFIPSQSNIEVPPSVAFEGSSSHPFTPPFSTPWTASAPSPNLHIEVQDYEADNNDDEDQEISCDLDLLLGDDQENVNVGLRRSKRTIKPTRCGTHGKLGGHM